MKRRMTGAFLKGLLALFCLSFVSAMSAQRPVPCRGPLSEEQLTDLIRGQVPEARLEQWVRTCGISFQVDGAASARLRAVGAPAAIITLLRKTPPKKVPVIEEFTANPRTVVEGTGADLRWRVKDADSVEVQPGIGSVSAEGSGRVVPQSTTAYKLVAVGAGGQRTLELTVEVVKAPVIEEFTANPRTSVEGIGVDLRWRVKDADRVEIEPDVGSVSPDGSQQVVPRSTTAYKLVAAGAGGQKTAEVTVEVVKRPRIAKFDASPASIRAGEEAVLSWEIENADSVEIDGGIGPVSSDGSRTVKPEASVTYALTARRLGGEVKGTVHMEVLGPALAGESGIEFVRIPAGEFQMGSVNGRTDENPVHRVRITKAFEMGKYEVTQAQWEKVMGGNPSHFKGPDRPVETVSWDDIQDFLRKLNAMKDGYRYRLPTEAEWEYAARAGSTGDSDNQDSTAWHKGNSGGGTNPVGTKLPNAWGLYDMLGNVWEWCQDWYDTTYYRNSPEADPPGPASGQMRVVRGGGMGDSTESLRSAIRGRNAPHRWVGFTGFRLVREGGQSPRVPKPPDASEAVTNRIPSLKAKVHGLRFFESGKEAPLQNARMYHTRFRASRIRYLNWEIELSYPDANVPGVTVLVALWYGPDGSLLSRQPIVFSPRFDALHSYNGASLGSEKGGAFKVGHYRVDILVEEQIVARGTFEVF